MPSELRDSGPRGESLDLADVSPSQKSAPFSVESASTCKKVVLLEASRVDALHQDSSDTGALLVQSNIQKCSPEVVEAALHLFRICCKLRICIFFQCIRTSMRSIRMLTRRKDISGRVWGPRRSATQMMHHLKLRIVSWNLFDISPDALPRCRTFSDH